MAFSLGSCSNIEISKLVRWGRKSAGRRRATPRTTRQALSSEMHSHEHLQAFTPKVTVRTLSVRAQTKDQYRYQASIIRPVQCG